MPKITMPKIAMPKTGTQQNLRNFEAISPGREPFAVVNANSCSATSKSGVTLDIS
jgi:hypothetical protein